MINTTNPGENLCGLQKADFQKVIEGKQTDLFILKNESGAEVAITNYGGAVVAIMVPDKEGKYANVIQGHDTIDKVINSPEPFLSTLIAMRRLSRMYIAISRPTLRQSSQRMMRAN